MAKPRPKESNTTMPFSTLPKAPRRPIEEAVRSVALEVLVELVPTEFVPTVPVVATVMVPTGPSALGTLSRPQP